MNEKVQGVVHGPYMPHEDFRASREAADRVADRNAAMRLGNNVLAEAATVDFNSTNQAADVARGGLYQTAMHQEAVREAKSNGHLTLAEGEKSYRNLKQGEQAILDQYTQRVGEIASGEVPKEEKAA